MSIYFGEPDIWPMQGGPHLVSFCESGTDYCTRQSLTIHVHQLNPLRVNADLLWPVSTHCVSGRMDAISESARMLEMHKNIGSPPALHAVGLRVDVEAHRCETNERLQCVCVCCRHGSGRVEVWVSKENTIMINGERGTQTHPLLPDLR